MSESWQEYRAVYERPASYLDREQYAKRRSVVERTGPFRSKDEARAAAMYRGEESHAFVTGYETRTVTATDWFGPIQ